MHRYILGLVLSLCTIPAFASQTYCNSAALTIPAQGNATPYPSFITVSGAANNAVTVWVTIRSLSHTFPGDLDYLLVSPTGRKMIIQSDVGRSVDATNLTYRIADSAAALMPEDGPIAVVSRPTSFTGTHAFGAPAPVAPYDSAAPNGSSTLQATFGGQDPNGPWLLYVVDRSSTDQGSIAQGWCLTLQDVPLVISEFRLRGPAGANDEFIELANISGSPHTVDATDASSGYSVGTSTGARCTIPNGTVIGPFGHYLCANSAGYSYADYPSVGGDTTPDATYATNIADNAGIGLFTTSNGNNYTFDKRIDAAGSTSEADELYREGMGYDELIASDIDWAWHRDACGKHEHVKDIGACPIHGKVRDTDDNATDFVLVDTVGSDVGSGPHLGAPGPQNISSPVSGDGTLVVAPLDTCMHSTRAPNSIRDVTADLANNSTYGTVEVRRTITNNTGSALTRLRWRVTDVSSFPVTSGYADLRPRTSPTTSILVDRPPCGSSTSNVTVAGTTLEKDSTSPSTGQPFGGGFNSSLSVDAVSAATPLANGASINVRFLFGVQQKGVYRFELIPEGLPHGGNTALAQIGCTDAAAPCADYVFRDGIEG